MKPRRTPIPVEVPPHGVCVWESRHDIGFRMSPERHGFAELFYVIEGTGVFRIADQPHPCTSGDVVLVPPGVEHVIEDGPTPLYLYGLGIAAELLRYDADIIGRVPSGRVAVPAALTAEVRGGLRRILFEQRHDSPGAKTLAVGLTLQLIAALVRLSGADQPLERSVESRNLQIMKRYVTDLRERFYEPVGIDQAAAELDISRRCFTRLFRQATGCTYSEYLEQVRIEYACRLLRETTRAIIPIAFECGYEDLSSFYRAFRRIHGKPPGEWRESARV